MFKLIVIIVSWNTKDITRNCLESLYNAIRDIDSEVWVVDNSSSDSSSRDDKKRISAN